MIIRGSDGDDEEKIVEMEIGLCRKYRLSRKSLYSVLRHGDFHRTYKDPERFWTPVCYAAFSGKLLSHNLAYGPLSVLLADFALESEAHGASWRAVQWEEMSAGSPYRRSLRDSVAIAHRYACCVADDYAFPAPDIVERLTPDQFRQFNDYLAYVSEHALIPAGKYARLACKRQLDDLSKSTKVI
jgi:hypothetical protein